MPQRPPFFYRETAGVRVTVRPSYVRERSIPHAGEYVFAYHVRLENVGELAAQLLSRRWTITDSIGEVTNVAGDGVVGEQPVLHPGRVHEYASFCKLKSPRGHMEGAYRFLRADGEYLEVAVPRFTLDAAAV